MKTQVDMELLLHEFVPGHAQGGEATLKIRPSELGQLSASLARLLSGGVSLLRALNTLEDAFHAKAGKALLKSIQIQVSQGRSFSDAMACSPQSIPIYFIQALKAGEISGNMPHVLEELALYLQKQESFKNKIRMAATYPLFIVATGFVTLGVLGKVVFPKIIGVYDDFGADLPGITQMVLSISPWLFPMAVILTAGVVLGGWYLRQSGQWADVLPCLPGLRGLFRRIALIRISRLAGLMLESGMVIMETIEMMEKTFEIKKIRNDLTLLKKRLSQGQTLSQGLEGMVWMDPLSRMLVVSAEESGELSIALLQIARVNEEQLDVFIQTVMRLIEPCLILAVGLVVGFMVVAMILPIFEIGNLVS